MAKVSLRIYNHEIENLVDRGELDEAIAHCRHVLKTFPKNLETYRLIGKAYLEAKRYNEAVDIFERLLMAVPDDFVAHVGMSIINDEQNNLDAAIWHMQRAFEVQPSNTAIQSELQRLYGRRDGVEPPKIRLTRGALAHMYVQGELYPQAIAEIESVLEDDRERQDMQVLLARAYFHSGQKSESAEICSRLLQGYPYCLDANRVLVDLLPVTEDSENVQTYRQRVYEMDPYAAHATGSVFLADDVSDAAVNLERLEWDGQPVDMAPEWRASRGIGLDIGSAQSDEEPDWLKVDSAPEPPTASTPTDEQDSISGSLPIPVEGSEDDIPEFLREAGWGESTGAFQEGPGSIDASDDASEEPALAEGDLPDWVKAMAPTGVDMESATPQIEPDEDLTQDDVPDWLQGMGDVQAEAPVEQPLVTGEELPDWLESMKSADEDALQPEDQSAAVPETDGDLPDWLEPLQPEQEQAPPQESLLEALQEPELDMEVPEVSDESPVDQQPAEETPASPVSGDLDMADLGASAEEQDDAIAWLEGLAAKHGAKPEELVTDPEARKETEPDWVRQAKGVPTLEPPVEAGELTQKDTAPLELPAEMAEESGEPASEEATVAFDATDTGELGVSAEEQDDAIAWLEGLASKHGAKPEELVTDPEARKEAAPDWVQQEKEADVEEPADETGPQSVDEEVAQQQPVAEEPAEEPDLPVEADEIGVWLQDLGKEDSLIDDQGTQPETEEDFTNWLSGIESDESDESAATRAEAAPEKEIAPEEASDTVSEAESESPEWLRGMEADSPVAEITSKDEVPVPDWLSDTEAGASQEESIPDSYTVESVSEPGSPTIDDVRDQDDIRKVEAATQPDETDESDWLRSLEDESQETGASPVEETATDDLPSWLAGLDKDGDQQTDEPALVSDDLPEWLQSESEDKAAQPEPTASLDWQPAESGETAQDEGPPVSEVEEQPAAEPATHVTAPEPVEPEPVAVPEQEQVTEGRTGVLSAAQDSGLSLAQGELNRGNIPGAMESYGKLIKKGKLLEEIIFDLREALYRYPVEVAILQTLGDAYMRANRLQEALDSYTKAEELLR